MTAPSRHHGCSRRAFCGAAASFAAIATCRARAGAGAVPLLRRGVCIDRQFRSVPPEPYMRFGRDDIRLLKGLGFDFVKVLLNPEPLLSGASFDPVRVWYVDQLVDSVAVERLPAVVCVHPEPAFKTRALSDPDAFGRFEGFLAGLARRLAQRWSPREVALQLMTEPYGGSERREDWNHWDRLQHRLWRAVRAAMPQHTLILSGDRAGSVDGLASITPVPDAQALYSFTFYEPAVFTQQGGTWIPDDMPYLTPLPYPSGPETLACLHRLQSGAPTEWRDSIRRRVELYASERWDRRRLERRIGQAVEWSQRHGGARLWCAEFGCYQAAPCEDRLRWLREVREAFEKNGIGWAYWSYNETFTLMAEPRVPFGPASAQTPDAQVVAALLPDARGSQGAVRR